MTLELTNLSQTDLFSQGFDYHFSYSKYVKDLPGKSKKITVGDKKFIPFFVPNKDGELDDQDRAWLILFEQYHQIEPTSTISKLLTIYPEDLKEVQNSVWRYFDATNTVEKAKRFYHHYGINLPRGFPGPHWKQQLQDYGLPQAFYYELRQVLEKIKNNLIPFLTEKIKETERLENEQERINESTLKTISPQNKEPVPPPSQLTPPKRPRLKTDNPFAEQDSCIPAKIRLTPPPSGVTIIDPPPPHAPGYLFDPRPITDTEKPEDKK